MNDQELKLLIRNEFEYSELDKQLCHKGQYVLQIENSSSDQEQFVGNIRCSCCAPFVIVTGNRDGSKISFCKA